ncbi:MAG: DNA-binding HxlR family transcriptional regulator, partial [Myxococcota bacterium]
MLVLRELLCGSHRFNDLRRGVPKMSATLLTTRLRMLQEAGVIDKIEVDGRPSYRGPPPPPPGRAPPPPPPP